jgi:hypothetical protein
VHVRNEIDLGHAVDLLGHSAGQGRRVSIQDYASSCHTRTPSVGSDVRSSLVEKVPSGVNALIGSFAERAWANLQGDNTSIRAMLIEKRPFDACGWLGNAQD